MIESHGTWCRRGLRDGVPIGLGYLAVSFTLGIAAKVSGMGAGDATLMSLLNNTSAGEFAALGIIAAGAPYLEMAFTQLVINLRYLLMSCALSQKIAPETPIWQRLMMGYTVTDEIFAISAAVPGRLDPFIAWAQSRSQHPAGHSALVWASCSAMPCPVVSCPLCRSPCTACSSPSSCPLHAKVRSSRAWSRLP